MICMYIYIYTYQTTIYLYIQNIYFSDTYCIWLVFSMYHLSHVVFFGQYGTISRPNPSRSCTIPVSWSLGLWGSWHLGGKYVKHVKQIYILVVYIYIYVCIYLYIYTQQGHPHTSRPGKLPLSPGRSYQSEVRPPARMAPSSWRLPGHQTWLAGQQNL
jgi:hypothetical protein